MNLKYASTMAYRAVRNSGILHLPSERTLADYTHWSAPHAGVQLEFVERSVHNGTGWPAQKSQLKPIIMAIIMVHREGGSTFNLI